MRVLIVEDEPKMAALIRRGMRAEGVNADVVGRGEDAVVQAGSSPYDAIVLDVMLPGMDGYDACKSMREQGIWSPVLMLTARDAIEGPVPTSSTSPGISGDRRATVPGGPRRWRPWAGRVIACARPLPSESRPPADTAAAHPGLHRGDGRRPRRGRDLHAPAPRERHRRIDQQLAAGARRRRRQPGGPGRPAPPAAAGRHRPDPRHRRPRRRRRAAPAPAAARARAGAPR